MTWPPAITWSRAARQTAPDLKGKTIAPSKAARTGMLDDILKTARLTWDDIRVV